MQRLLRGRLFYVFLSGMVIWLYAHAIMTGHGRQHEVPETQQQASAARKSIEVSLDMAAMQKLAKEKPAAALVMSATSLATMMIAIFGIVLSVWGILSGRLKSLWQFPQARLPAWSVHELSRIVFLVLLAAALMPFTRLALLSIEPRWELDVHLWIPVSMVILDTFIILAVLVFAEGKRNTHAWETVGFVREKNNKSVRLAIRSYVTLFPWLMLLLFLIVEIANKLHWEPPAEPIQELIFQEHRPWVFAITVLLSCVIGPLAEECFFRGVLYPALKQKTSRWVAMGLSGALFGMIHTNLIGFLPIMLLGCLLAYIYERSGSLTGSFLVHAAHNSLLMGMAIVYRYLTPAS